MDVYMAYILFYMNINELYIVNKHVKKITIQTVCEYLVCICVCLCLG